MVATLFSYRPVKGDRSIRGKIAVILLVALFFMSVYCGLVLGAYKVPISDFFKSVIQNGFSESSKSRDYLVLVNIRPPRVILAALVGSALAISGVLMQGLFRNPLADPGIMGVSSGSALGAVIIIVGSSLLPPFFINVLGSFTIVTGAFLGGLMTTIILYFIATRNNRTSVTTMLLAGIALSALCAALTGFLIFIANDNQLRDITFWNLGSLAGATWSRVAIACPFILTGLVVAPFLSRGMNALSLDEAVAGHLGFEVQRLKYLTIFLVAFMCGGAVSVSGNIGFIGIIVPHILRLTIGPDHRFLIPCSALLGASMLILTDTVSRIIVAPAELPIGIITSLIGGPFFLWVLLKQRGNFNQ